MKKKKQLLKILAESFAGHLTALIIILLFIDSFCIPAYFVGLATFLLFLLLFIMLEFTVMKKLDKLSGTKNYYKSLPFIYFFLSTAITIASYISKSPVVQS